MNININISLPYLWGEQSFQRNEWSSINYLVGPNATGKTQFAEQLKQQCQNQEFKVRYLSSERLAGLERQQYGLFGSSNINRGLDIAQFERYKSEGLNYGLVADAFATLKEKLDVRIKIEASLSQLFGRRMRLAEEGGFLKPKIRRIEGDEYNLNESECHGLKELITLLTFIYNDDYNCLIIDEPELHLHPQFQTFFLQEIRKIAGDPITSSGKKCFFIITHSPYFVDLRTVEDLKYVIFFQHDNVPTYISDLEGEDNIRIKRMLPRLNTHHKQFFFASRPIFVEGYFDQQIFSLIQERRGKLLGASGSCIIDINGKNEADIFFKICKKLNIDAQFIMDLDVITQGNLKRFVSEDNRYRDYLQSEGLEKNLMEIIKETEEVIDECLNELESKFTSATELDIPLQKIQGALSSVSDKLDKKRYIFLVGLKRIGDKIKDFIPNKAEKIGFIEDKIQKIIQAFRICGVYVLCNGSLENYLPEYNGDPYIISKKSKRKAFEKERDFILSDSITREQIHERYNELIDILDEAIKSEEININSYLTHTIRDWIHKVQSAYNRDEIKNIESFKRNAIVEWNIHSRVFDLLDFSLNEDGFVCKIKLKSIIDPDEHNIEFHNKSNVQEIKLEENQNPATDI